jgi:hypothetical protein
VPDALRTCISTSSARLDVAEAFNYDGHHERMRAIDKEDRCRIDRHAPTRSDGAERAPSPQTFTSPGTTSRRGARASRISASTS